MSNYTSYSSSSFTSSSTTTTNGETRSSFRSHETYSTPEGRGERSTSRENDGPEVVSERHYAADGQPLAIDGNGNGNGAQSRARIEDVTDADAVGDHDEQAANDRKYEERIEDEYAKREGGA